MDQELVYLSATRLAQLIKSRDISPVELVEAYLARIDSLDETLNSYLHIDADGALLLAREAETAVMTGAPLGPLHGIPAAFKDSFHVKDMPISVHSRVLTGTRSAADSTAVARLTKAGTITLGKLNTTEFQSGSMEAQRFTRNPWDTNRTPGSSSAGSGAAVSAGLTAIALGGDTGGSIRIPASFSGVVGLKPTFGRISRSNVVPLSWSNDNPGPMARTVADVASMLAVIAGSDPADPMSVDQPVPDYTKFLSGNIQGLKIGIPETFYGEGLDPEVDSGIKTALQLLEDMGAVLLPVDLPGSRFGVAAQWAHIFSEAYTYHQSLFSSQREKYGPAFLRRVMSAALLTPSDLVIAQRLRAQIANEFTHAFKSVDVIITPTVPFPAYPIESFIDLQLDLTRLTRPVSVAGIPALSVPCGFTEAGLPYSMQIIGPAWEEATVLRVGHTYQEATKWHQRRPPITAGKASTGAVEKTVAKRSNRVDASWVQARATNFGVDFLTTEDYEPIANLLAPIQQQLAEGREHLNLQNELLASILWDDTP